MNAWQGGYCKFNHRFQIKSQKAQFISGLNQNKLFDSLRKCSLVFMLLLAYNNFHSNALLLLLFKERNKRKLSWWLKLPLFPSFSLPHFTGLNEAREMSNVYKDNNKTPSRE